MKKYSILTITVLLCLQFGVASCQNHKVFLNGKIDPLFIKDFTSNELIVRIKHTSDDNSSKNLNKAHISDKGDFGITLNLPDSLAYLSFEMFHKAKNRYINLATKENKKALLNFAFLFHSGDSILMTIRPAGRLSFSGRGSSKLQCQYQIYNIEYPEEAVSRAGKLLSLHEFDVSLSLAERITDLTFEIMQEILLSYKGEIPDHIYNIMALDAFALAEFPKMANLHFICNYLPKEKSLKSVQEYFEDYVKRKNNNRINTNDQAQSLLFANFLFEKELNYFRLYNKNSSYKTGNSFKELYESIKKKYRGKLRDKLLFISFERLNQYYSEETRLLIKDALETIQDSTYYKLLIEWQKKQFAAFPFELEDTEGKMRRLSDFRGKVIVLDFWYTGCTWCADLNKKMKPIIEKYKDNPDIAFITISIDQNKHHWLNSVSSGVYTSTHAVNLYTNGMGKQHPLIQNYNITGYPRQMIIDQDGNLVTSSPPRVGTVKSGKNKKEETVLTDANLNTKAFTDILDKLLKF